MNKKVLIVEDQFVEANDLRLMLVKAGYTVTGIARSVPEAQKMISEENPDFILLDIFLKGKQTGIDLARQLKEEHKAFIFLSANSNEDILAEAKKTQPYGFIVKPFREKDLLVTLEIAEYRHEHSLESKYRGEREIQNRLKTIIADNSSWQQKLYQVGTTLQSHIPFDFLAAGFNTMEQISCTACSFLRIGFNEYQALDLEKLLMITGLNKNQLAVIQGGNTTDHTAGVFNDKDFEMICKKPSLKKLFAETFQLKSHLTFPLRLSNGETFSFCFYSRRTDAYRSEHIELFHRLQQTWTQSIEKMLLAQEKDNTPAISNRPSPSEELSNTFVPGFEGIIGNSHHLLNVFDQVMQVAPYNTSVLILGESGTGKEKIADCIHHHSPKKNGPLIKVNCAALPGTLIESELFGHEKGSFTGATDKRIGKFLQAHGGTIFLDEIGEMPVDLQVKLLRVLQEKEIETIGGKAPIKIDVRIIAASNRNLEKEVAEGRFRLDLYYRLNAFPLQLPSLKERKEDIPLLVSHFINYYNRKAGKKIIGVSDKVLKKFMAYHWPGNIRELEHIIERSILLAKGSTIEDVLLPVIKGKEETTETKQLHVKSIDENERDHILAVLKISNGRIWGSGGAAELLNLPPTTLSSKMKKLGIKKEYIE